MGIIGSGNRNFNKQFCLTAHQYSEEFGFPVLDEFELRGTEEDVIRIMCGLEPKYQDFKKRRIKMKRKMLIFKHRIAEKMNKYYMNKLRKWTKIDYDCCSKLKDDNGDDNSR